MIKLELKFTSGEAGFSQDPLLYTQLARTDNVAIYERSRDGKVKDYEVFLIKIRAKGTVIFQKTNEDDEELYPATSQFGRIAWSISHKERAMYKYEELCKSNLIVEGDDEVETPAVAIVIPDNEFTVKELAEQNHIQYIEASNYIKTAIESGAMKFVRLERRNAKGKMSQIFSKA